MIFTRSWISQFIDISDKSLSEICATLNAVGIEVESSYALRAPDKVVVGFVKEKSKVENSDKLSLCKVDIGEKDLLQIVCGAKNVAAGQFVAVALVGAVLPNGTKIAKTKLRGVESEGMICSSSELGFEKTRDGIMLLDDTMGKLVLGRALNAYEIFNDEVIEVDITPNRGDCLSVYGIARELSVAYDKDLKAFDAYEESKETPTVGRILRVQADKNLNSCFDYRVVEKAQPVSVFSIVAELRLATIGKLTPCVVSNILQYATHATGVLFNAYDLKALSDKDDEILLQVRKGAQGESKVYHEDKLLSTSGIYTQDFGKVDENSRFIIIEANYTTPSVIAAAKDSYKKLDEDSIYRAFRGSEPQLKLGMQYLMSRIISRPHIHIYQNSQQISLKCKSANIRLDLSEVEKLIGVSVKASEVVRILKRLNFEVDVVEKDLFSVKAPIFRSDINNFADVCEEITRVIGIDNIPAKPLQLTEQTRLNECYYEYKDLSALRHKAVANGYFESVHYVLDSEEELGALGFKASKTKLINPISTELNALRPTLINHLLNAVSFNTKNSKKIIKLFTSGAVFDENLNEKSKIAFVFSGFKDEPKIANKAKPEFIDFYSFLLEMKTIIGDFTLNRAHYGFLNPYEQASIHKNGLCIGFVGRVHLGIERDKDLQKTYLCELDLSALRNEPKKAKPYSKFPQMSRDLSVIIPKDYEYEKIKDCIKSLKIGILKSFRVVDLYEDASLQGKYSLTIAFVFQNDEKTLADSEVSEQMELIVRSLDENLGLKLR